MLCRADLQRKMRILVVTRSYPSTDDLYQYPFVHRRVLAYIASGHEVAVFRPADNPAPVCHSYEGVTCRSGDADAFAELAASFRPGVIVVHGLSEMMWPILAPVASAYPIRAWLHGSEIPEFCRQKALWVADPNERAAALQTVKSRCAFWRRLLSEKPDRLKLVFVSNAAVDMARKDWGHALRDGDFSIIPNPIDTDLFAYHPKAPDDRWRMLMIRPFDSPSYGNDMAVAAILRISEKIGTDRPQFTIIGDGPLFEETLQPLAHLPNVRIERRFLTQSEIAAEHRRHGIFMVPTRLDTQGVSRDEAMASGLVPATNRIPAVSEFVDDRCAALADADDAAGLAKAILAMLDDPALYMRRSAAAAERVRRQCGHQKIIPLELTFLAEACDEAVASAPRFTRQFATTEA